MYLPVSITVIGNNDEWAPMPIIKIGNIGFEYTYKQNT